jgi:hypothetical protein
MPYSNGTRKRLAQSPFVENGRVEGQIVLSRRTYHPSKEYRVFAARGGEVAEDYPVAGFWTTKLVDATQFVKLFVGGMKRLQELSSAGTKVFEVLYRAMQKEREKLSITLVFDMVDQITNPMSQATYKRGLRELIDKGFIADTPNINVFWVNPAYIWNGDRLFQVDEFVLEGTPAAKRYLERVKASSQKALPFEELPNENTNHD